MNSWMTIIIDLFVDVFNFDVQVSSFLVYVIYKIYIDFFVKRILMVKNDLILELYMFEKWKYVCLIAFYGDFIWFMDDIKWWIFSIVDTGDDWITCGKNRK